MAFMLTLPENSAVSRHFVDKFFATIGGTELRAWIVLLQQGYIPRPFLFSLQVGQLAQGRLYSLEDRPGIGPWHASGTAGTGVCQAEKNVQ